MSGVLKLLKNLLGKKLTTKIRPIGHGLKSWFSALYFGFPARKLKLIGITSTKGKTSTTIVTGRLMNLAGLKTGYISTAVINLDGQPQSENINVFKMTTIDGFWLQKYLREMVKNDCEYVVLEMSSQGLEQNRHWGLGNFFVGIFMNLYPEHLEAHGGLDNYRKAKAILFQHIDYYGYFIDSASPTQLENSEIMWNYIEPKKRETIRRTRVFPDDFKALEEVKSFYKILSYKNKNFYTNFITDFEIENLVYSIKTVEVFKPNLLVNLQFLLSKLSGKIPGRMDFVVRDNEIVEDNHLLHLNNSAQSMISVLVDYAHEPKSLEKLMESILEWKSKNYFTDIIHILSSDGAGRDDWKKPVMGELSFRSANYSILTTDNYDASDDPQRIVDLLSEKLPEETIFTKDLLLENLESKKIILEIDRRKAFEKALVLAKLLVENKDRPNVITDYYRKILIVSTGVGSEKGLTQPSGNKEWDEKGVWKEEFMKAFSE